MLSYRLWEINNSMSPSQPLLNFEGDFKMIHNQSEPTLLRECSSRTVPESLGCLYDLVEG